MLIVLDVRWIFDEMRNHPENGPDADFIFWFGALTRLAVNAILVPISLIGWRVKAVLRKNRVEREAAGCSGSDPASTVTVIFPIRASGFSVESSADLFRLCVTQWLQRKKQRG